MTICFNVVNLIFIKKKCCKISTRVAPPSSKFEPLLWLMTKLFTTHVFEAELNQDCYKIIQPAKWNCTNFLKAS